LTGVPLLFELRSSPIHGHGAFATRRIRKGRRIIEYTGERITEAEADRRYNDDDMDSPHTFLFTVGPDVIIDGAAEGGNEARFINHSCEPNCEAVIDDGRIFIEALRNIPLGQELTFDYQLERDGRWRRDFVERYACRCGTAGCRGTLLIKPKRPKRKANRPDPKGL
jgi:SET domain-containing protein